MVSRDRPLMPLLLLAVLALGVVWSLVTPPWQAPDENSHFGYVQHLAETGALPGRDAAPLFSTEQRAAAEASNSDLAAAQSSVKMEWSSDAFRRWLARPPLDRADGGGPNPAANNPPLYYLAEAPAYLATSDSDVFTRLQALRIMSLLWLLVAVAATWLLAGEIFGPVRAAQVVAAGVVGLAPMILFISASVSPDSMLFASWSVVFWLGARMLRRPASPGRVGAFTFAVGAACVVKATSYALLPGALLAIVLLVRRSGGKRRLPAVLSAAAAGMATTLGLWLLVARAIDQSTSSQVSTVTGGGVISPREFVSYLWQFYLPRAPFQTDFASLAPTLPAWDFLVKGSIASFGWTEVQFDAWLYWLVLAAATVAAITVARSLWIDRREIDWHVLAFFACISASLLIGLHISEYRQIKAGALNFYQGRYVLPLAPLAGLAAGRLLTRVPRAWQAAAAGGVLSLLVVLNLFSLALTLGRFYV